jgi:hypothetical protein
MKLLTETVEKKINRGEWFVGKNLKSMKKILINKKRIQRIHFYSL